MNSTSYLKTLMARWGVELSLVTLLALVFAVFQDVNFLTLTKSPETLDRMSVKIAQDLLQIVEQAEGAQGSYLKSRSSDDLQRYNRLVVSVNQKMVELAQSVREKPEQQALVHSFNQSIWSEFEALNRDLTLGKSIRHPAEAEKVHSLAQDFFQRAKPSDKESALFELGIFQPSKKEATAALSALLLMIIFISRSWQRQELQEQKKEAMALQNRSLFLDTLLASMSEALIVIDQNGHFTKYNAAAQRIVGTRIKDVFSEWSLRELGFYNLTTGLAYSKEELPFFKALYGETVDDLEIFVQNAEHPDGIYVSLSSRSINDIDGSIRGALVVFRDVTRRKQLEHEYQKAREAAIEASGKKSDFLAAMSHEIRTPMNGVIGMATLLADTSLSLEQQEYVGTVKRSAESLLMLINDILDYSKIEAGKISLDPQPFDLNFLIRDVAEIFRPAISEKGIEFELSMSRKSEWSYIGDQGRLRQVLVNLLGNAVKFTDRGCVGLTVTQLDGQDGKALLRFEIRDTGPGLREDERKLLFQRYFQTKAGMKFGGTGLGLSISKQLIDLMGGAIGVESVYGAGSMFWFNIELPRCLSSQLPRSSDVTFSKIFKGRVLVAEDQLVNQRVAINYLQKLGLSVDIASQGKAALEMAQVNKYDLIFMDCQMPVMNGFESSQEIRKFQTENNQERTPIVALTADAGRDVEAAYQKAGMDDYLAKPIELPRLIEVLHRWLRAGVGHIDLQVLEKLKTYVVNDQSLITALIEDFVSTAPNLVEKITKSIAAEDLSSAAEWAHALKSTSATLGATLLAETCQKLELCRESNQTNDLVIELESQFNKTMAELLAIQEERQWQKSS